MRVRVDAISARRETRNVIGEIGPEDAERVYMAGGHLDSVVAGPGLNDNGSGVAAVLEVAEQLATRPLANGAALRVGFWGRGGDRPVARRYAEKPGRAGAPDPRLRQPRHGRLARREGRGLRRLRRAGRAIETALREGLPPGAPEERLGGASDHASFAGFDIPVGGIFTGLDRCYHRAMTAWGTWIPALAASAARATAGALVALAAEAERQWRLGGGGGAPAPRFHSSGG